MSIVEMALQLISEKIRVELRFIGGQFYMEYYDDEFKPIQILITEDEYNTISQALEKTQNKAKFEVGEVVIYQNGDKFELGIVKRICEDDEYFIWYHTGDTAARTNARYLHKISNSYAFHIYRLNPDDEERKLGE